MTKTTNYQLNQWAKSDRLMMDDFNADNQKIDAALAAVPRIAIGSYVGTGSAAQDTNVNVGFAPRAVFLCSNNNGHDAKLVLRGDAWEANAVTMLQLTDTGFRAKYGQYSVETNSNATYYYLAIA